MILDPHDADALRRHYAEAARRMNDLVAAALATPKNDAQADSGDA